MKLRVSISGVVWAYACARKTMPTRLSRLARKAMLGVGVLLVLFLVLGQLRWMQLQLVMLAF